MKRWLWLVLLLCLPAFAVQQVDYTYGSFATSLFKVATTGSGDEFHIPFNAGNTGPLNITWQYSFGAGSTQPTSHTTTIEGSLDNVNWFTLDTSSSITSVFSSGNAGEMRHLVNKNVFFLRCKISALVIGSAVSETCGFMVGTPAR